MMALPAIAYTDTILKRADDSIDCIPTSAKKQTASQVLNSVTNPNIRADALKCSLVEIRIMRSYVISGPLDNQPNRSQLLNQFCFLYTGCSV